MCLTSFLLNGNGFITLPAGKSLAPNQTTKATFNPSHRYLMGELTSTSFIDKQQQALNVAVQLDSGIIKIKNGMKRSKKVTWMRQQIILDMILE